MQEVHITDATPPEVDTPSPTARLVARSTKASRTDTSQFESLDYEAPINRQVLMKRRESLFQHQTTTDGSTTTSRGRDIVTWVLTISAGAFTGLVAYLLDRGIKILLSSRNDLFVDTSSFAWAFFGFTAWNLALAGSASFATMSFAPAAAGSGIPEVRPDRSRGGGAKQMNERCTVSLCV